MCIFLHFPLYIFLSFYAYTLSLCYESFVSALFLRSPCNSLRPACLPLSLLLSLSHSLPLLFLCISSSPQLVKADKAKLYLLNAVGCNRVPTSLAHLKKNSCSSEPFFFPSRLAVLRLHHFFGRGWWGEIKKVNAGPTPQQECAAEALKKPAGCSKYEQYVRVKPQTGCEAPGPEGLDSRPVNSRLLLS